MTTLSPDTPERPHTQTTTKPAVSFALGKLVRVITQSYVLLAVIAFVLIDGGLGISARLNARNWPITPYQTAQHSWVWWNVNDFRQEKQAPDVVLLGSSLMMAAFHGGDAAMFNVPQNVAFHHKSVLFERLLKAYYHRDFSTFVFALGGEMASDAYAINHTLLTGDKRPRVIIYGIAPRDFMDHSLNSAASTEIFKYMSRLGDLNNVAAESRGSIWEMGEYYLGRLSFVYDHRPDFIYLQHRLAREAARKWLGYKNMDYVRSPLAIRKQAFLELPENNGPNEVLICPPSEADTVFMDNSKEYAFRYQKPNMKQFNGQLAYLDRMLKEAHEKGTRVILVNMPLTEINVALMPPGFYADYLKKVNDLAAGNQALVLDLNDPLVFPKKYFGDTAHLNVPGGKHFMEVLAARIAADKQASATIQGR